MKCLICKEDSMTSDKSTYFAQLPNCYVIIENVPCLKCTQCGEVVYSASVMERIDDILKKVGFKEGGAFTVDQYEKCLIILKEISDANNA